MTSLEMRNLIFEALAEKIQKRLLGKRHLKCTAIGELFQLCEH